MEERWSADYLRRQKMLATLETPTLSEAKESAGLPLSSILFDECHQELKVDFGLAPYLEGPRGQLWVSPSDLLIGKVALKPPLTQKHIQALTHEGILELGVKVEQKLLNEMRIEREAAVKVHEEHLTRLFAAEMEETLEDLHKKAELKHGQEMNEMRLFFDNKVCQLLWQCSEQVRGLEDQMQSEFDSLNTLWQKQLEVQVQETVHRITEEFLEKMRVQEQVLVGIFNKQIQTLKFKKRCAIEFERTKCKELLIQMNHKLHCQNISNLMYLLCKERRKCKNEKLAIENHYETQLHQTNLSKNKKSKQIQRLIRIQNNKTRQLKVRERCLIEVLRQFQKFIYFALKSAPTQGEFLLNINKLIEFELHDFCLTKYKEKPAGKEKSVIHATSDRPIDNCHTELEESLETSKFSSAKEECEHSDALPAFYFNDKMYVREDFRDMFSAGIEMDQKNSLWNPDVEELLNVFRKSIHNKKEDCHLENVKSFTSSVHFNQEKHSSTETIQSSVGSIHVDKEKQSSKDSSFSTQIQTVLPEPIPSPISSPSPLKTPQDSTFIKKPPSMEDAENEREIKKVSLGEASKSNTNKKNRKLSLVIKKDRSLESEMSDFGPKKELQASSATPSRLALARDSVILHLSAVERKSLQNISSYKIEESLSKSGSDKEKTLKTIKSEDIQDTLIEHSLQDEDRSETLQVTSQESLEMVSKPSRLTSRLLLATDSIELLKSTMGLVGEKDQQKTTEKHKGPQLTSADEKKKQKQVKQTSTRYKKSKPSTTATPRSGIKVAGSRNTKEHEKPVEEFTKERIISLVNIMKENPSLIRLFTSCHK